MENKDKLKCKVVMLPTEKANKKGDIIMSPIGTLAVAFNSNLTLITTQHLYFVSDREIKEDDSMLIKIDHPKGRIRKCHYIVEDQLMIDPKDSDEGYEFCKQEEVYKIEASTDSSLNLPLIGASFLEKYVEKQGEIDEVMIDMTGRDYPDYPFASILKTRRDNTIIISPVKDSWTREEVKVVSSRVLKAYMAHLAVMPRKSMSIEEFIQMIENNL